MFDSYNFFGVKLGILKIPPQDQQLFNKDNMIMEDDRMLQDYGLTGNSAKAQSPATVGLAVRYIYFNLF